MSFVKPRFCIKYATFTLLFVYCQVIGVMCALPEISMAEPGAFLVGEHMVCQMDGTVMCPPSAVSSPERQVKQGSAVNIVHAAILLDTSIDLTIPLVPTVPTLCSRSSVLSIVPISIGSSSVLRI